MFTLFNTIVCATLVAQTGTGQATQDHDWKSSDSARQSTQAQYVSVEKVMDGEVWLQTGTHDRSGALGDQGRIDDDRNQNRDNDNAEKAQIENLILDGEGKVCLVAISTGSAMGMGGRTVLVPMSKLKHDSRASQEHGKSICKLAMSKHELQALPEFDADEAKERKALASTVASVESSFESRSQARDAGLDELGRSAREAGTDAKEDGDKKWDEQKSDMQKKAGLKDGKERYMLATDLMGIEVRGSDEEFGKVENAALDVNGHCIDYLIVSAGSTLGMGGDKYLIPIAAIRVQDKEDDECVLMVSKSTSELERGVKFEAPDDDAETFITPEVARRANEHFGTKMRDHSKSGKDSAYGKDSDYNKDHGREKGDMNRRDGQ